MAGGAIGAGLPDFCGKESGMRLPALLLAVWMLCCVGLACTRKGVQPMPGTLNTEGAILKTEEIPIGGDFILERRQVLLSDYWNDVFPLNVPCVEKAGDLVSRLLTRKGVSRDFIGWVSMPRVSSQYSPQVSADGRRVVFDSPRITRLEGQYPRDLGRGIRMRSVMVYSDCTSRALTVNTFSEVYGVSCANHWRPGNDWAAFTTYCRQPDCEVWSLAVISYGGNVLFDANNVIELSGLEFIGWSPDGQRIAALKPDKPHADGEGGGVLMEFNLADQRVRTVAAISPELASENLGKFEQIIYWEAGQLKLTDMSRAAALPTPATQPTEALPISDFRFDDHGEPRELPIFDF